MLRHAVQAYISLGHDDLGDDDSGGGGGGGGGRNDIDVGCRAPGVPRAPGGSQLELLSASDAPAALAFREELRPL